MSTMTQRAFGRNGRRATSALRPSTDFNRPLIREHAGLGRIAIRGAGALEFARFLDNGGAS
jgi:hypothetical protein